MNAHFVGLGVVAGGLALGAAGTGGTFVAVADATVEQTARDANFGAARTLLSDTIQKAVPVHRGWNEIDVTRVLRRGGLQTLVLMGLGKEEIAFASRESGRTAPWLVLEA